MGVRRIRGSFLLPHEKALEAGHMKFTRMNYRAQWYNLIERYEISLRNDPSLRWSGFNKYQAEYQALGIYKLQCFAERIAKDRMAPWGNLTTEQALNLYLINKHHWTRNEVADLQEDDYLFLLRDDLAQMKLDTEEAEPIRSTFETDRNALQEVSVHWN